ncbi:MAG: PQQ-dependent sugar dehydrogenase [Nitrososphaerota archaeon]
MKIKSILLLALFLFEIFPAFGEPILKDDTLVVKKFVSDLSRPTTMTFVDNEILVLQKDDGKVRLISNGVLQEKPVLDVSVSNDSERGLLGIITVDSTVYLYFTESTTDGGQPLGNRIYRYIWDGQELVNPTLIKDLPATPGPNHDGGAMVTGLDGTVYAVIGDLNRNGILQNYPRGEPDDTGVILRVAPEGPYYAMGIRNSFGLAIDPVTGNLWQTENGPDKYDEVNLVSPNFNSGWEMIMGPATESELALLPSFGNFVYSDPEFSWEEVVAPTALSFIDSTGFEKYKNSLFVGDCNFGNLYKFELNSGRTEFVFDDQALADRVINTGERTEEIVFGTGFGCITDLEVGPDGSLYVVSLTHDAIYRITPKTMIADEVQDVDSTFPIQYLEYITIAALIIIAITVLKKVRNKNATQSKSKTAQP